MSGIEALGLILATLPLCIEIAKAYSRGVDSIYNLVLRSRRDEELSEFYDEFYWNVTGTSTTPSILDLSEWHEQSETAECLRRFFGSEAAYHRYLVTIKSIAKLLAKLLADQAVYLDTTSADEAIVFAKLREFAQDRDSRQTQSNFAERFRFFKKAKDRKECLCLLEKWNHRLDAPSGFLTLSANIPPPWNNVVLRVRSPTAQIRILTRDLYTVLSDCWRCACTDTHEARFCLNLHGSEKSFSDSEAEFEFLVSSMTPGNPKHCWKEGTVVIRSADSSLGINGSELQQVCGALRACLTAFRLRLLMEDIQGQHHLWNLDPKPRRISLLESEPPVSLQDLLTSNSKMGPYEKRELAVICAYSLLLLHDTPWLRAGWDKSSVSFFYKPNHEPDFTRPFISTRFEKPAIEIGSRASGVFHRNSHILGLGILFIEIFNEKPIESWRNPQERVFVSPETEAMINLLVADRVVKKMDRSLSRSAVEACLDLDWAPQGRLVKLEDPEIRNGLFKNVIQPLEAEIAMVT
ncbi:hypothetical protein BCR34DRAFT_655920 [Clohesyomyces aquaticus]|uniref:DUF7580 domain-containing protein n=1 Tax=Clohesyomyces aquaticus TaxID=1231657 RepID=A0A1Y2A6M0_9PLEO|nr:hypothetical protein BCR34DRAFT_655920 [Clohesyomyces aquaticus]